MKLSIFTDELGVDITEGLPILRDWGMTWADLRGRVFGKHFEGLDADELKRLRDLLDESGFRVGCLQSSLAKVHLPEGERYEAEKAKLEAVIRAADVLDCRLVRAFFFWQPQEEQVGAVAQQPDQLQIVLDRFAPLYERAREAGLVLSFENCGVTVDEVLAVLDALNEPGYGLAWDCANEYAWGGALPDEAGFAERVKRTNCVHVKARGLVPGHAPEDQDVPWGEILRRLALGGFDGPVSIETHNKDKSRSNTDVSRDIFERLGAVWPGAAPAARPRARFDFKPLRFVVVGLGRGRPVATRIQEAEGTELAGVVDINPERAREIGEELGVEGTTDLAPWLERDDVDAVNICTPTGYHAEGAIAALEAGKHAITTKPMEASLEACDRMVRAADKAGRLLAVDFEMRLTTAVQRMKQRIAAGDLGRFLGGSMALRILRREAYFKANDAWRGTFALDGGGVMSNQNIHHTDQLVYCLGLPQRVRMVTRTQLHDIEAEDLGCALWEYEDDALVQIYATSAYPQKTWNIEVELHGETGALWSMTGGPVSGGIERWFADGAWEDRLPEPEPLPWDNLSQNLADAVRTAAPLVCDGRDGRRSRQVLEAMYASAREDGGWVNVADYDLA